MQENYQERIARARSFMDSMHETAEEIGLGRALGVGSMTTEERLWAEIAHYERIIEQAGSSVPDNQSTVSEALTSWEQGVSAATEQ